MTLYTVVLFLHVVAVLVLVGALSTEALVLFQLRRTMTSGVAHVWSGVVAGLPRWGVGSLLVLFFSGGYLTDRMSAWTLAWPKVAVLMIVLIAGLGAITGRRMVALRRALSQGNLVEPQLGKQLQDPVLKLSLNIRIALVLGAVLLMTAQPGRPESLGILGVSLVFGVVPALPIWRRSAASSAIGTMQEK